ncbi:hypothetical protein ACFLUM_03135 [Chloroflexota bacterium]
MSIKTTVCQVAMVGGDHHIRPDWILVDERSSRLVKGRRRGNLYALVEVSGPRSEREIMSTQLLEVVREVYYGWRGSVTAGLQQAVRDVNAFLFDENRDSLPDEQWSAGISCVALRDDDLFIVQGGPAAVLVAHDGQATRYPDVSPWLTDLPSDEVESAALGSRRDAYVSLFHARVAEGDTLLVLDSSLARRLSRDMWFSALSGETVEAVLGALAGASKGKDHSALAVRLAGEKGSGQGAPSLAESSEDALSGQSESGQGDLPPALAAGARLLQSVGVTLVAVLASLWAVLLTLLRQLMPSQPSPQEASGRQDTKVSSGTKRPSRSSRATGGERDPTDMVQKLLLAVAIGIPLIVAAIVLFVYLQRGQARTAEIEALWQSANASWEQASTAGADADARTRLAETQGYLEGLSDLQADYPGAVDLQKRIDTRLDEINQVRRINWVAPLTAYPGGADLTRVVVQGAHVFVMDRSAGKVYHHQLDELQQSLQPGTEETVLLSRGDVVGDVLVGDLVDMVWMPAGEGRQRDRLVILESNRGLLEYDPATEELRSLVVAQSDTWQMPEFVGSYYGRFYLLDSQAGKIWRYAPTPDGYSSPPDDWLETETDLLGAVDMAIGNSIYLLYGDGRLAKFTTGSPDTFDVSGWNEPLRSPSALYTRPPEDVKWLWVADRGNSRIVKSGKDGEFKEQFRQADEQAAEAEDVLGAVTGLFVDEIGGRAFVLSGQKLYLLILPD